MKIIRSLLPTFVLCILVLVATIDGVALAQSGNSEMNAVEVPQALGPDAMQALVSKLNEKQTAALVELIELLDTSASNSETRAVTEQQAPFEIIEGWFSGFAVSMKSHLQAFPEMVVSVGKAFGSIFQGREPGGNLKFLLLFAVALGAGMAAEWLINRLSADKRAKIRQAKPEALLDTLNTLSARAGIEIGGVIIFTVVALIAASLIFKDGYDRFLVAAFILNAIVIARIFKAVLHFVLAPRRPELRLVHTDSWTAQFIERNFTLVAATVGVGFFLAALMQKNGIPYIDTVRFWLGLFFHLWIIFVIWKAREGLTKIIKGRDENLPRDSNEWRSGGLQYQQQLLALTGFSCNSLSAREIRT